MCSERLADLLVATLTLIITMSSPTMSAMTIGQNFTGQVTCLLSAKCRDTRWSLVRHCELRIELSLSIHASEQLAHSAL